MSKQYFSVAGEIVPAEESVSYPGQFAMPSGYCRMIDGKPCGCSNAWTLRDSTCPCAPGDKSNPICKK